MEVFENAKKPWETLMVCLGNEVVFSSVLRVQGFFVERSKIVQFHPLGP